jgi:membrane-bound metal-dependent hydrolase YbcI (DUF457 family)
LWPVFVLTGLERVEIEPGNTAFTPMNFVYYPYSHSLAMAAVWSVVLGLVYFAFTKYRTGAFAVSLGVISHWFLDLIVHRPDLPLYPGGTAKFGFDLWNSIPGTIIVEVAMFAIGVYIYARMTRAKDRIGSYGLWAYVIVLLLSYTGNILSPPPPSAMAVAAFTPIVWIFVVWPAWVDKHRAVGSGSGQPPEK